jgi:hypothetical protein
MFALGRGFCSVKTEAKGAVKDIKHEYYGMTQMYVKRRLALYPQQPSQPRKVLEKIDENLLYHL